MDGKTHKFIHHSFMRKPLYILLMYQYITTILKYYICLSKQVIVCRA